VFCRGGFLGARDDADFSFSSCRTNRALFSTPVECHSNVQPVRPASAGTESITPARTSRRSAHSRRSDVRSELQRSRQARPAGRVLKKAGGWTFVLSRRGASPRTMRPRLGRAVLALAVSCYEIRGGVARIKRRSSPEAKRSEREDVEPYQQKAQRLASNDEDDALEDEDSLQRRSSAAPPRSTGPDGSSPGQVQCAASQPLRAVKGDSACSFRHEGALPAMFSRSNTPRYSLS
jgi:hypothetical protein